MCRVTKPIKTKGHLKKDGRMREEKQLCHLTVISTVKNKTEDVIYRRIGGTILWLLYQILLLYCITVYPTNTLRPVSTVLSHHKTLLCLFFSSILEFYVLPSIHTSCFRKQILELKSKWLDIKFDHCIWPVTPRGSSAAPRNHWVIWPPIPTPNFSSVM